MESSAAGFDLGHWNTLKLPADVLDAVARAPSVMVPRDRKQLLQLSMGGSGEGTGPAADGADTFEVRYPAKGAGDVLEATVVRARNGLVVNYSEAYMRRRDPQSMVVADTRPSEKTRFEDRFKRPFADLREEVLAWLAAQDLLVLPFISGSPEFGYDSLLVGPRNAAFFAAALADLQGKTVGVGIPADFEPAALILLAPPFRHTVCEGKQVVVHNRTEGLHEIFALNLYPGPSAKKGVYGVLLTIGESEGWITAHSSTVQVVTPYDNIVTIMHEGASGGGKSEMLEHTHRQSDGRLLLGTNLKNADTRYLAMGQSCDLRPVTDDMALCHPSIQKGGRRLVVVDAEAAWFLRVNHIDKYGIDPAYERLAVHPPEPLIFMNMEGHEGATCLIWEHIEDSPGKPCPNPRVIVPRAFVPGIVNEPVAVDIRSFGVRTPPCTAQEPSYGILGILHYVPPSLAWLWRLVAPRGYSNPSITDSSELSSEGVGSYWPFATGRRVVQANLLLTQILATPDTRYTLTPNQHIGAWEVGFMPQWLAREYMARRGGARFRAEQLVPARSALLGYALTSMQIEGTQISQDFLQVNLQPEVGNAGYDAGAAKLADFFADCLSPYLKEADLDPLGRKVIEACLAGCTVQDLESFIPYGGRR